MTPATDCLGAPPSFQSRAHTTLRSFRTMTPEREPAHFLARCVRRLKGPDRRRQSIESPRGSVIQHAWPLTPPPGERCSKHFSRRLWLFALTPPGESTSEHVGHGAVAVDFHQTRPLYSVVMLFTACFSHQLNGLVDSDSRRRPVIPHNNTEPAATFLCTPFGLTEVFRRQQQSTDDWLLRTLLSRTLTPFPSTRSSPTKRSSRQRLSIEYPLFRTMTVCTERTHHLYIQAGRSVHALGSVGTPFIFLNIRILEISVLLALITGFFIPHDDMLCRLTLVPLGRNRVRRSVSAFHFSLTP
jgi:hypothetical protein